MHLAHDERNGRWNVKQIHLRQNVSGTVHVTNTSMEKEATLFRPPLFIDHPSPVISMIYRTKRTFVMLDFRWKSVDGNHILFFFFLLYRDDDSFQWKKSIVFALRRGIIHRSDELIMKYTRFKKKKIGYLRTSNISPKKY